MILDLDRQYRFFFFFCFFFFLVLSSRLTSHL